MRRRQVLAALGAVGAAGCLNAAPSGDDPASTATGTPTNAPSGAPTTTTDATTGQPTTEPEPRVGEPAPVEGCPALGDRVVCGDADGQGTPGLSMTPDADAVSRPTDEVAFTLANDTDATFRTNFYGWRVYKRVDGDWHRVAPTRWPEPVASLPPDESHTWTMTVDNSALDRPIPLAEGNEAATVVGLGGGEYAFGLAGRFRTHERTTAAVARFRVEGDRLDLEPTANVTVEGVEGDALVATERVHGEAGDPARLVATRVDEPEGEVRETITEQLLRRTHRRNAIALFQGRDVSQVRVEGYTGITPAYRVDEPEFVRYDGATYRIESERRSK